MKENNKVNIKQIIKEELENILREEELEEINVVSHDPLSLIEKKCDELDGLEDRARALADVINNGHPVYAASDAKRIAEKINRISNEIRGLIVKQKNQQRSRDYRRNK